MPPLDRVALLAASVLLPSCVLNRPADITHTAQVMPAVPVQVARVGPSHSNQTDEPPLAAILVASASSASPNVSTIVPARAEMPAAKAAPVPAAPADESTTETPNPEPKSDDSPLLAALKCYLNKSPAQAARYLEGLDPAGRDLLTALLPLAVRLGEESLSSAEPQDLATLVADLQMLIGPLRERAALEVPKLCFCRPKAAPAQYGMYELLDENHRFRPGEVVGLYVELRNFTCAPHGDDFRTHVQMAIEVHNDRDEVVWRCDPPSRADPSLSPRQDYCHVGRFALPANLPAGAYTLWLKVTDVPTGRAARRSLDFRVTTVGETKTGG
jgi:hypothetical protein